MTQKQILILGAVAVAGFVLWQRHTNSQVKGGTYPVGSTSPTAGYVPSDSAMYNWMMGQP